MFIFPRFSLSFFSFSFYYHSLTIIMMIIIMMLDMNECVGRVGCFTTKLVLCMSICFTHGIKLSILNDHFQSNVMPEYIV